MRVNECGNPVRAVEQPLPNDAFDSAVFIALLLGILESRVYLEGVPEHF